MTPVLVANAAEFQEVAMEKTDRVNPGDVLLQIERTAP